MKTNRNKLEKKQIIVIYIFLIIRLHILDSYLPDSRPKYIKRTLARQGYDYEYVGFEFVRDGERIREWIFESSVPFDMNGRPVSQWSIISYSMVFPFFYYHVEPYPTLAEND